MNKCTSFANHITNRYVTDLKIMQQNINTSLVALSRINNKFSHELLIQYNIFLSQKLLESIKIIQKTMSLDSNDIIDLEIISTTEIGEIINHLKIIYKKEELLELDSTHVFKIIEISKFKILSVSKLFTCILYISILTPHPYSYQRVYPIPREYNEVMLQPAKYRLLSATGEFWTNENCAKIEYQVLCANKLITDKCSFVDNTNCNFLLAKNNYQLIVQLDNNKILASCKNPISH